jgi:hypothetical protein
MVVYGAFRKQNIRPGFGKRFGLGIAFFFAGTGFLIVFLAPHLKNDGERNIIFNGC